MYDKNPPENGGFVSNLSAADTRRTFLSQFLLHIPHYLIQ